ncbi:MAG: CotH kinase family protein [Akkermansiaceae bacterium]
MTTRNHLFQVFAALLFPVPLFGEIIISEFLAENSGVSTLDEDRFPADWIELHNSGESVQFLGGYHLTDDASNPTKWAIPNVPIGPGGSLLIFASGKDRQVPGSELHTNFSLDAKGEFLGLVKPDGSLASNFGTVFPRQVEDVSYGLGVGGAPVRESFVGVGSPLTYLVPTKEIGTAWQKPGFDDSEWLSAHSAVGWGYSRTAVGDNIPPDGDLTPTMRGVNASVYLRYSFQVDDAAAVQSMVLKMKVDDGFVAYLNGKRIGSKNDRTPLLYNSTALRNEEVEVGDSFETYPVDLAGNLVSGENILAIQGLNASAGSSDFIIISELVAEVDNLTTAGAFGFFEVPTPGEGNTNSFMAAPQEVVFSAASQAFTEDFNLTLSHPDPETVIYYTTDGTLPTNDFADPSPVYVSPIEIDTTVLVRARAFAPGALPGKGRSEGYFKMAATEGDFSSNLPVVLLSSFGRGSPPPTSSTTRADTFMLIYESNPITGRTTLAGTPALATRGGYRKRGSSSSSFPKYGMSFESWDEFGEDKGIEPLGFSKEADWILNARYTFDLSLMRNAFLYELSNQVGQWAAGTRFVELFNDLNGGEIGGNDYFGVYTFMEKIEIDKNRVDLRKLDPWENGEEKKTGGFIFKNDRPDPGEPTFSVSGFQRSLVYVDPDGLEATADQRTFLRTYANEVTSALRSSDGTHPTTELHFSDYLDVDSFVDHFWLNLLAMDPDWGRLSQFFHKDRGGKIAAGPIWDYDRTMGSRDSRDDTPLRWEANTSDTSFAWFDREYEWFGLLFGFTTADDQVRNMSDPQLRTNRPDIFQQVIDRWYDLRAGQFGEGNMERVIDAMAAELSEAQARNFERWGALNPGLITGTNFAEPGLAGWEREVSHLKGWLKARTEWIDGRFFSPPGLSQSGGVVPSGTPLRISASSGEVYYTTDGGDPRAPGGSPAVGAVNGSSLSLNDTTVLMARSYDGQQWSAPTRAVYVVDATLATHENLVISEIMYHPAGPSETEAEAGFGSASFEYLELLNISGQAIDLTEVNFTDGIDFNFINAAITELAPGGRLLLVRNKTAFEMRYGLGLSSLVAGEFANETGLSRNGERIGIVGAEGVIRDLTYNDKSPWPESPDGNGPSLVLVAPEANPSEGIATNWRTSVEGNGNPGSSDAVLFAGDPSLDQDEDGLNAFAEHALGSSDTEVNLEPLITGSDERGRFTVTFSRNLAADDTIIILETSADMENWTSLDATLELDEETHREDGTVLMSYRTPAAANRANKLFARLRIYQR